MKTLIEAVLTCGHTTGITATTKIEFRDGIYWVKGYCEDNEICRMNAFAHLGWICHLCESMQKTFLCEMCFHDACELCRFWMPTLTAGTTPAPTRERRRCGTVGARRDRAPANESDESAEVNSAAWEESEEPEEVKSSADESDRSEDADSAAVDRSDGAANVDSAAPNKSDAPKDVSSAIRDEDDRSTDVRNETASRRSTLRAETGS